MIINKNVIFILCLLFCSKALSYGGLRSLVESIQTGSQKVHEFFWKNTTRSDEVIDEEFYRTLDEVLEMKEMSRGDLLKVTLDELRGAATDPLKLIYSDRYVHPNRYPHFFDSDFSGNTFDIDNHHVFPLVDPKDKDLFRTFLQRQLDINDKQQMKHLRRLVNKIAKEHNLSPYKILYLLCRHNDFKNSDFIWFEDLYLVVMRGKSAKKIADQKKKALQNMAQSCFNTDSDGYRPVVVEFDKDRFFSYWEGQAFRDYIIDFNFINRYHLVDTDILLSWVDELKRKTGSLGQLPDFIRFSFEDAPVDYDDIGRAMNENPFLRTVFKAINEDSNFARKVERILKSVPEEGEPSLWDSVHGPSGRNTH